jgi:hypothetical protein
MKIGKKGKDWIEAKKKLKIIYAAFGITSCEVGLDGCWKNNHLTYAHRYKRSNPKTQHTFSQTLLCCLPCHMKIEYNKELTERLFKNLRS